MAGTLPPPIHASVYANSLASSSTISNVHATDPLCLLEQALRIARCAESPTNLHARARPSTHHSSLPTCSSMQSFGSGNSNISSGAHLLLAEPLADAVTTICTILREHCRSNPIVSEEAISACRCLLSEGTRNISPTSSGSSGKEASVRLTAIGNALRFNGILNSVSIAIQSYSSRASLVLQAMALMTRLLSCTSAVVSIAFVKGGIGGMTGTTISGKTSTAIERATLNLHAKLPKIGRKSLTRNSLTSVISANGSSETSSNPLSRTLSSVLNIHLHNENIVCAVLDLLNVIAKTEKAALLLLSGSSSGGALLSAIQLVLRKMLSRAEPTASGIKFLKSCAKHYGTRCILKKHCGASGSGGLITLLIGIMKVLHNGSSNAQMFKTFKRTYRIVWLLSQTSLVPLAQDKFLSPTSIYRQNKSKTNKAKVAIVHPNSYSNDRISERSSSRLDRFEDPASASCSCSRGDTASSLAWFPEDVSWNEYGHRPIDIENIECADSLLRVNTWKNCSCDENIVRLFRGDSDEIPPPPFLCNSKITDKSMYSNNFTNSHRSYDGIVINDLGNVNKKQNFHSYGDSLLSSTMLRIIDRVESKSSTDSTMRGSSIGHDPLKMGQFHKDVVYDAEYGPLLKQINYNGLTFESRFECGNLRRAVKINDEESHAEYDLMLTPDINDNSKRSQWFLFAVSGALPGKKYKFNIMNLVKKTSLYTSGLQPLVLSVNGKKGFTEGWSYSGFDVVYFPSPYCQQESKKSSTERSKGGKSRKGASSKSSKSRQGSKKEDPPLSEKSILNLPLPAASVYLDSKTCTEYSTTWRGGLYGVSFSFVFDNPGHHYVSMCYPYSYSALLTNINRELEAPSGRHIRRSLLCKTLTGHRCDLLTITDFDASVEVMEDREYVFISSRVHPGETNSSWVMHGIIQTLTSDSLVAKYLRRRFIFKLCPMLNPDGVINGSTRCSLSGEDLNRQWGQPNKSQHPTIWSAKTLLGHLSSTGRLSLFIDLHGHSREEDFFVYGCDPDASQTQLSDDERNQIKKQIRIFPYLLSQINANFSYDKCSFKVQKSKLGTGRVVVNREIGCSCSYTLEISLAGSSQTKAHFSQDDLLEMGDNVCEAIYLLDTNITTTTTIESLPA